MAAMARLQQAAVRDIAPARRGAGKATQVSLIGLTERERDVLTLLIAGHCNRAIGELVFVSPTTAARHVANIYTQLDVNSRAEATAYALQHGLV